MIRLIRALPEQRDHGDGVVQERHEGTPQGGPLSPLLANVLLDEVDKELERRGHRFVRYADDCNVYVRSRRAGERVMALLRRLLRQAAVDGQRDQERGGQRARTQVPGLQLLGGPGGDDQAPGRRQGDGDVQGAGAETDAGARAGAAWAGRANDLRRYLLGWKAYFRLAQTPRVWRELDEWMRHRLRAIQLKHWKRGTTIYRELRALGRMPGWLRDRWRQTPAAGGATAAWR